MNEASRMAERWLKPGRYWTNDSEHSISAGQYNTVISGSDLLCWGSWRCRNLACFQRASSLVLSMLPLTLLYQSCWEQSFTWEYTVCADVWSMCVLVLQYNDDVVLWQERRPSCRMSCCYKVDKFISFQQRKTQYSHHKAFGWNEVFFFHCVYEILESIVVCWCRYPTDAQTYSIDEQFLWGSSILVSPVLHEVFTHLSLQLLLLLVPFCLCLSVCLSITLTVSIAFCAQQRML